MVINSALPILLLMVLLLAVAAGLFVRLLRRSRAPGPASGPAKKHSDTAALDLGVSEAIAALRDKVPGGKFEQRVPWILLIGEEGAGKTTLAGHLSAGPGDLPVPGAGVRWSFLDGGVLIDVPGAFLIGPEGKDQQDGRWNRFLRLLVRHRPARPIDGVVLAIPAPQLFYTGEAEAVRRKTLSATIRNKLDEAQKVLGLAVPVYVMVTKCDQVRGFGSFCWEMNPDLEDDMFGWSNPNTLESAFAASWVDEAFDAIQESILRQQMRVFGSRAATPGTDELFIFPLEFDAMRVPLRDFLTGIFRETSYVDSNFARGIYFCGDSSTVMNRLARIWPVGIAPAGAAGIAAMAPGDGPGGLTPSPVMAAPPRRQLVFAKHLFDFKVFLESKIGRPVTNIRFTRNRTVMTLQSTILIFALVVAFGMMFARWRLGRLEQKFERIFAAASGGGQSNVISLPTAYGLLDTLGEIKTNFFWSPLLPASWGDPINRDMTSALSNVFGKNVLPAIQKAITKNAEALLEGGCGVGPAVNGTEERRALSFAELSFTNDPQYAALELFLTKYKGLEDAIGEYNNVRRHGGGTYADLDSLFLYLLGKRLPNAAKIDDSYYYQQALARSRADAVPGTEKGELYECARIRASALVGHFYKSWFIDNPLAVRTGAIAEKIDSLHTAANIDLLSSLVMDIRAVDEEVLNSNTKWLTQPNFEPSLYPALALLPGRTFVTPDFMKTVNSDGGEALAKLKKKLLYTEPGSRAILEQRGTELHLSGPVIALETGLEALQQQDFMNTPATPGVKGDVVIWSTAALAQAAQLRDSYDKFVRERMPLFPPDLRGPVQRIAAGHLAVAVKAAVMSARTPVTVDDDVTTLLAIRSFKEASPLIIQLQQSLPANIPASSGVDLPEILPGESLALAGKLNGELDANPAYPYSAAGLRNWNAATPLSNTVFDVDSVDKLEEFLSSQRERIHALATEYAQPLASYLQSRGLLQAASFDRWAGIIRDEKDYDAKKPGNPIAALETFIRTNLDRITPPNACRATEPGLRSNDYFLRIRSEIQQAAVRRCSQIALQGYTSEIAGFFNSKLAGRFPFGPVPSAAGAPVADPRDVAEFLSRIEQRGPALVNFASQTPAYAGIAAFLRQSDNVRRMFAGGLSEGAPYADVAVYFRVNQPSEIAANQIIDWEFQSGDQIVHYPGTENGVRWHFGDPVRLALRYARDSPDIPQAGADDPDVRVDGRTVSWDYRGGWPLFALLASHGGQTSDFGQPAEALPGTLRFVIPTALDNSRAKGASPAKLSGQTRLYIRLGLRVPGAKEPRDVPVTAFPLKAPLPPGPAAATE